MINPNKIKADICLKKYFLLLTACYWMSTSFLLHGQEKNLVVNPSFEQGINFNEPTEGQGWTKCLKNDTPDYITFTKRGEPDFYYRKYIGGLLPYDGDAYVGIFCLRIHPLNGVENVREFIQTPLVHKLEKDSIYTLSMQVALDPESNTAINNFNVYFAEEAILKKREKDMYELFPRVKFKRRSHDSISWMKLETQYKARGNEAQLVIGNFLNDKNTGKKKVFFESKMEAKWKLHELERVSYYYVDMVSVKKTSMARPTENPIDPPEILKEPALLPDTSILEIAQVKHDSSIVLNHIFFDFDESFLLPASYEELDALFDQLQKYQDLNIIIEGHTDNLGTYEYNISLSLNRAMAVRDYLLDKGLQGDRIKSEGYGYTRPLSDNRTEEGRQLNRRVAFRISD